MSSVPSVAPYGSWRSPLTAELIASSALRLGQPTVVGSFIYWTEGRPQEAGRNVLVRWSVDRGMERVSPASLNVRTRLHEYGGQAYGVTPAGIVAANYQDQRLYLWRMGADPHPLTGDTEAQVRYADGMVDEMHERMIWVREDHRPPHEEPCNTIVGVSLQPGEEDHVLVSGQDFYAFPRLSPDGRFLAWISWDHPNMPWDSTELWVAPVQENGGLGFAEKVAGGAGESIFQPEWSPEGTLHFVSDRSGWWNLYRWRKGEVEALCPRSAEFGLPLWVLGLTTYGFISDNRILCTYIEAGISHLAILETSTGELQEISTPYTSMGGVQVGPEQAVFLGASPTKPTTLVRFDPMTGHLQEVQKSMDLEVDPNYFSPPETIEFPTHGDRTAYAFYYRPSNADFQGPPDQLPPLLVKSHGGPTGATTSALSLGIQFWTSRGFAVVDVNYGGSTGYGRAYREQLLGQWGIVDVEDCIHAVKYLVDQGFVDPERLAIQGSSAGGYTTLAALTFHSVFKAGASYYGVSDLEALVRDTHKFESRYLDRLIGPYPAAQQIYQQRSPIHFLDQLDCPVIFLQGAEDVIVPPNQAEVMVEALRNKGLPVAYVLFPQEQHGFRQAHSIQKALEAELYFYGRIFGFEPADDLPEIEIDNLAP